jgi:hypothetical protein
MPSPADSTWLKPAGIAALRSASCSPQPITPARHAPAIAISGLPPGSEDSHVFHAGTARKGWPIVTAGGRVLCVTTLSDNVRQAQKRAYDLIVGIHFDGMQYRRDIGHRASADEPWHPQPARSWRAGMIDPTRLQAYFTGLQTRIVATLEAVEGSTGARFRVDPWQKEAGAPLAGSGCTCIIEGGRVFERGGVAFSQVSGAALPASATAKRPELAGRAFAAMGVSLVLHPENPYCPTAHMNVRALIATRPMPSLRGGLAAAWI